MKTIDNGHIFELDSYDGGEPVRLTFMKREGEGYPYNVGSHPGTNCQEVLRALISRTQYLNAQVPALWNKIIIAALRSALWAFEKRAAERHGRDLKGGVTLGIEDIPTCRICGHIQCIQHSS